MSLRRSAVGIPFACTGFVRYTDGVDTPTPSQAPDASRHDATSPDLSRPVATEADDYVSLKEAREIFLTHGRPVSERTLQRSCVKGHIAGKKIATGEGEKWFALKSSVFTRIAELDKFDDLRERHDATSRDASRQVVDEKQGDTKHDTSRQPSSANVSQPVVTPQPSHSTMPDVTRHDATGRDMSLELERIEELYKKIVTMTEAQIEDLRKDKETLQADKAALVDQHAGDASKEGLGLPLAGEEPLDLHVLRRELAILDGELLHEHRLISPQFLNLLLGHIEHLLLEFLKARDSLRHVAVRRVMSRRVGRCRMAFFCGNVR